VGEMIQEDAHRVLELEEKIKTLEAKITGKHQGSKRPRQVTRVLKRR